MQNRIKPNQRRQRIRNPAERRLPQQLKQKVQLPKGYFIEYGGQFESEERATNSLLFFSLVAAVAIGVLMFFSVGSLPATIAIMINLPLALIGGLLSVVFTGGVISIASLVGFITLFGVAVQCRQRNSATLGDRRSWGTVYFYGLNSLSDSSPLCQIR